MGSGKKGKKKEKAEEAKSELFDPRCCTYKLSATIRDHVDGLIKSNQVEPDTKSILVELMEEEEANKSTLTYDSLVKLHKYVQRADPDYADPFYVFSDSCRCIEPKARDNKQLDERLKYLRLRNSQNFYNSMTLSVDRLVEDRVDKMVDRGGAKVHLTPNVYSSSANINNVDGETTLSEFRKLYGSSVAVINSFLVFICTFIFCYKALEYSLPQPHITAQVLFGLGGSTVVAIAELYFLLRVV